MMPIQALKNAHYGEDIWVIAAGPSAGYVRSSFFQGKCTIGVNRVWKKFDVKYVICKEPQVLVEAAAAGYKVIASKHAYGSLADGLNWAEGEIFIFEHCENRLEEIDLNVIGTDRIVVSYSTITSAMHVAAYMGARNIILVGHDCGLLDGSKNYEGYPEPLAVSLGFPNGFYEEFLSEIEPASLAVRDRLQEVYVCNIYSLNPFLNFGLEGRRYERAAGRVS